MALRICVETISNEDYDDEFTDPFSNQGNWQPYDDFEYASTEMDIYRDPEGVSIAYHLIGTIYIRTQEYKA